MAKKGRKPARQGKNKWSRSNIVNYVLGLVVALSMVGSSVFVFGAANSAQPSNPAPLELFSPTPPTVLTPGTLTPAQLIIPTTQTPAP